MVLIVICFDVDVCAVCSLCTFSYFFKSEYLSKAAHSAYDMFSYMYVYKQYKYLIVDFVFSTSAFDTS